MSRAILTIAVIGVAIVVIFYLGKYSINNNFVPSLGDYVASTTPSQTDSATTTMVQEAILITAPKGIVYAYVSSTSQALATGLSGRTTLPSESGMLFIFPSAGVQGFWMKDMLFPIDMIWLDEAKTVVGVTSNVLPNSYPNVFYPPTPIRYVLEVNSGKAKSFGIATGTTLTF
jgi:uncharacterized membrane protein (UPF0127 family)